MEASQKRHRGSDYSPWQKCSSTSEVRGGIVHWQANERRTLSIASEIFQVLLVLPVL
jgi:hypothetical protein